MTAPIRVNGHILAVDDRPENLRLLAQMLEGKGHVVRLATGGAVALEAAAREPPDLVLLDVGLPDIDGYEVCRRLKAADSTRDVPVVFLSAFHQTIDRLKAFGAGGVDYVSKPFHVQEVIARVETHLRLRRTEARLRETVNELRQVQELRENLVHMMVHDMRSPLHALLESLRCLGEDLAGQLGPQHRADIEQALEGAERLRRMTDDLLDLSRLEAGQLPLARARCDLVRLIRDAVANVRGIAPDREVWLDAPAALPVDCDAELVRRVAENLVSNGLKHSPHGTSLRVCIAAGAEAVRVAVRDQGAGIAPEYQESIFKKFGSLRARQEQKYHSIGLGLAFCKLAVEAHQGRIGVESSPGQGSTFWFTLPAR